MHIHYLQHVPFEGLGSIANWLTDNGLTTTRTQLFKGDTLPQPAAVDFLIIMGGPMGIHDDAQHPWLAAERAFVKDVISEQKVVLGICLGAQLIADALGAAVTPNPHKEIGWFPVRKARELRGSEFDDLFPEKKTVFHWHGDTFTIPHGAIRLAESDACINQGFLYQGRVLALQFHLETTPASAEALIENCGHEIVPAPYIQSVGEMVGDGDQFQAVNELMAELLAFLTARAQS